jgi:N-methylhydantoinase A
VLVDRRLRREIPERLRHDGRVDVPLDDAAVRSAARGFRDRYYGRRYLFSVCFR